MFDPNGLLIDVESRLSAVKRVGSDVFQPEYFTTVLLSLIGRLPEEWHCESLRVANATRTPSLEDLLQALSIDIENSKDEGKRTRILQALLRMTILLYGHTHNRHMRSTGSGA